MPDLVAVLIQVSSGLKALAPLVGASPIGTALQIGAVAIDAALVFAAAGKDPLTEIQRIHDADPLLQEMRSEWDRRINERFGQG